MLTLRPEKFTNAEPTVKTSTAAGSARATRPRTADSIEYREMRADDLRAAAILHKQVFADYFLGHMDRRFLELFYAQFLSGEGNYAFVALDGKRVVGAVIGSTDLGALFGRLYRRHFFELGTRVAQAFLRDSYVRRHFRQRIPHVLVALRSRFRHRGAAEGPDNTIWPPAQLLSVGVAPTYRGTGAAERLTTEFCDRMAADGVEVVGLSVLRGNDRAIRFYEKTGWRVGTSDDVALTFWRPLRRGAYLHAL